MGKISAAIPISQKISGAMPISLKFSGPLPISTLFSAVLPDIFILFKKQRVFAWCLHKSRGLGGRSCAT